MAAPASVNDGAPDQDVASPAGSSSGSADHEGPDQEVLEAHLAQLEDAARAAAKGAADAQLLDAVEGVRLQTQRFREERSGLQVRRHHALGCGARPPWPPAAVLGFPAGALWGLRIP